MAEIKLERMTKEDFQGYMADNIRRYASEGALSGRWEVEESLEESEKSIKEALPHGIKTKNNFFFNVVIKNSLERAGVLWLAIQDKTMTKSVFVFDILIFERYRNNGLGSQSMTEIETWSKGIGAEDIWLHAFWHNQIAISLYRRLGFRETGVTMLKHVHQG